MLRLRIMAMRERKQLSEKEKRDLETAKEQLAGAQRCLDWPVLSLSTRWLA